MSVKKYIYKDEELKAKRVFTKVEIASKSTYNYNQKTKSKDLTKLNTNPKKKNTQVVIKITSGSKHYQALSKHIDYISRDGSLPLLTSDIETYVGKDENLELKNIYKKDGLSIPNFGEEKKEKRHTINMVFSMNAPEAKLKEAVYKTIKEKFPNNFFVISFHGDTDNPHCHVCLKVAQNNGKRVNIKKQDLANLKVNFAKNLNNLGVEATAKIRNYEPSFEKALENFQKKFEHKAENKMHYYQLVNFGEDHYKFNKNNKMSFYVQYRSKKGITTLWSNDFKRVVKENNLQKGEMVKFKIIGQESYNITRKAKIEGKFETVQETLSKPIWSCDVVGREKAKSEIISILPNDAAFKFKNISKVRKYQIVKNDKIKFRKVGEYEKTNREQYRQRVIQERTSNTLKRGIIATTRNDMRVLSQEYLVRKGRNVGVFLHTNALHKLESERSREFNYRLRWTTARDTRTSSRTNDKIMNKELL